MDGFPLTGTQIVLILGAIVLIALVVKGVRVVPQSEEWTVERFGRYVQTLRPGLNVINPIFSTVRHKVSMRERVIDVAKQPVIFKDNATAEVDAIVFAQVVDTARAAYQVEDINRAITNLALTNIRSVLGSYDMDEGLSSRDQMNAKILQVMDAATDPWGTKITRVEIKEIDPPRDLIDAMASQMKAEREKRAQILEAQGVRQAAVERAEGEKQAAILKAEGALEAARREAEGRERLAEAEARATEVVAKAIAKNGEGAVQYFVATKYVEALAAFANSPNQKTFFMPVEFSGVLSAIQGISELLDRGGEGPRTTPWKKP
ncbi:MAG: SPFH/Band 7/PHB domain protein [Alphaproteobacteria bacterium]|nr:SPFH/Band 7/PHB domain protein [Alphaproteobacteria bacterium]